MLKASPHGGAGGLGGSEEWVRAQQWEAQAEESFRGKGQEVARYTGFRKKQAGVIRRQCLGAVGR